MNVNWISKARFTPESFCELMEREKVTSTAALPTMLAMLLEYPDFDKYDLCSLISVVVGGAALPFGLKAKSEGLNCDIKKRPSGLFFYDIKVRVGNRGWLG